MQNLSAFVTKFSPRTKSARAKFIDGQKVEFKITLTATAMIHGSPEWDDEDKKYLYAVNHVVFTQQCKEDIYLTDCQVKAEEPCLLWENEIVTANLPSCEFDPD